MNLHQFFDSTCWLPKAKKVVKLDRVGAAQCEFTSSPVSLTNTISLEFVTILCVDEYEFISFSEIGGVGGFGVAFLIFVCFV